MEDRGGKGLLFLQSVVTLAHSTRPCFIFPVSVHVDDVYTTGSCRNVLVKRWRKGKRTTEGYNWHWKIFIHELLCIKKRTSERRERVSFFMHGNKWIKIVQAFSMVWCFYFIRTEIFSYWKPYACCPPLWSTIVHVYDWTNDVFSVIRSVCMK